MTQEGLDRVRLIKRGMNKTRAVLVDSESACLEGPKRVRVKPISIQEAISGKTRNLPSIKAAYLYLSGINKEVFISTINRYLDTGKSVKGFMFSTPKNSDESF